MNTRKKLKKTNVGVDLIRRIAAEGDRIFSTQRARELSPEVGLKDSYLREALYHLRRNGWIVPLRRGLYALSASVPGVTPAHEFEVAMALISPAAVSHWSGTAPSWTSRTSPQKGLRTYNNGILHTPSAKRKEKKNQ